MSTVKLDYFPALTFPRFVAAMIVVLCHFFIDVPSMASESFNDLIAMGHMVIGFFFFLSGFLIYISTHKKQRSVKEFYKRRISRIYPVYLLAFLFTALVIYLVKDQIHPPKTLIYHATMLQAWRAKDVMSFNSPTWTISVELLMYLLFPFIFRFIKPLSLKSSFWFSMGFWVLSLTVLYFVIESFHGSKDPLVHNYIYYYPPWHLNTFVFGVFTGKLMTEVDEKQLLTNPYSISIFLLLVIVAIFGNTHSPYAHNGMWCPAFSALCILLVKYSKYLNPIFSFKPLIYLGNLSYTFYIFQLPIYFIYQKIPFIEHASLTGLFIYIAILLVFSGLVFQFFEIPMHRYLTARSQKLANVKA